MDVKSSRCSFGFSPGKKPPRFCATVNCAVELVTPSVAVTVTVPRLDEVASPCMGAVLLMVAIVAVDELHRTAEVRT